MARGAVISGGYVYPRQADRGGYSWHIAGPGLQMTRALGDAELDSVLDRTPDVYSVPLGDFVLVASDGLFDPAHAVSVNDTEMQLAMTVDVGGNATDIVGSVRQPKDNITAVLWTRRPRRGINFDASKVFRTAFRNPEAATT